LSVCKYTQSRKVGEEKGYRRLECSHGSSFFFCLSSSGDNDAYSDWNWICSRLLCRRLFPINGWAVRFPDPATGNRTPVPLQGPVHSSCRFFFPDRAFLPTEPPDVIKSDGTPRPGPGDRNSGDVADGDFPSFTDTGSKGHDHTVGNLRVQRIRGQCRGAVSPPGGCENIRLKRLRPFQVFCVCS